MNETAKTTTPPDDHTYDLEDLEAARTQMAATVLEIRARYEQGGDDLFGQRLLSAAVRDLEDIDTKLEHARRTR